ncbi:ubiquinone/menaquinone biosynthesis C-methylase UbiE [Paenibacillus phyllosphaerae]|uniref:Ubiquinone/menaquinone biosynthesis C-methylase UbiE n=1 Tax=Paenibacillus phyllosphaerae TaxID=274593 RepID=A0A7W5FLY8_9BACL|nr:class I SAM-dependent methyltransferase [Paenibacillus phyllosphaerae]MBB3109512.1 ubiquinone/menaquinone biosynthesis C-methylase UbiE [Paenibacillus phyllosphaerae]
MPDHEQIYRNEAEQYERLIAREDYEHQIERTIRELAPHLALLEAADIGAGTGRLTRLLAPLVRSITAMDASAAMLEETKKQLADLGVTNWRTSVSDHRKLSLPDQSVDLLTAGWTICYVASSNLPGWEQNLADVMKELERIIRPGGTAILFENFGTGSEQPNPPDFLTAYYAKLENDYGFHHKWIRTDYRFASPEEAETLCRFFFGDWLADPLKQEPRTIVPECTGVWWKHF